MAIIYAGNEPSNRASLVGAGNTNIETSFPILINGILRKVEIFSPNNQAGCKFKLFWDDGTNFVFVKDVLSVDITAGLNTLTVHEYVRSGYLLGFYGPGGVPGMDRADSGGADAFKAGDVTANSAKATWTIDDNILSIRGHVWTRVGVL